MIMITIWALAIVLALSSQQVMSACVNNPDFEWPSNTDDGNPMKNCTQIRMEPARREAMCPIPEVNFACPHTCGTCCEDDDTYKFQVKFGDKLKHCAWISRNDEKTEKRINNYCTKNNYEGKLYSWDGQTVRDACPKSCNFCFTVPISWQQMGDDLDGEAVLDRSVSLSSNGEIVAIGAPFSTIGQYQSIGLTRVYKWDNSTSSWQQMGSDLEGEASFDYSGKSVSLSSDGETVAIGANGSGRTRVYKWCSTILTWHQMGGDLDGKAAGDHSGGSVSLSSNGETVAIGAHLNDQTGSTSVYNWHSSTSSWQQMGDDLKGEAAFDYSGRSVSLSSNGETVAIGAIANGGNGHYSGHTRVYKWSNSTWQQMSDDLDGEAVRDQSGYSVSLSSNGETIAIGAPYNDGNGLDSGRTRVYNWHSFTSTWQQMGDDLDGEAAYDRSGYSVSLSSNGETVAIGGYRGDDYGPMGLYSGHTRMYKWDNSNSMWQQMGGDLDGEATSSDPNDRAYSVSLSSDGDTVAIGQVGGHGVGNGANSHVRVYSVRAV